MYKAFFFHRSDLATNIQQQIMENNDAEIGEFDGFCYASWRANAVYRTLEDMAKQGLITKEEYNFCNEQSWNHRFNLRRENNEENTQK